MPGAFNKLRDMASKIFPSSRRLEQEHVAAHRFFRWSRSSAQEQYMPWNHLQFLVENLEKKRDAGLLCDTHIKAGGQYVLAHRAVLCSQCKYFRKLCGEGSDFSKPLVIDVTDAVTSAAALEAMVKYLYTGKMVFTMETLPDILSGINLFELDELRDLCCEFMVQNITPLSCIHIYHLAHMYHMEKLCQVCNEMARFRFHDVIQYRDEVLAVPGPFLRCVLLEGAMATLTLEEILSLFLRWMHHQPEARAKDCVNLLQAIPLLDRFKANQLAIFNGLNDSSKHLELKKAIEERLQEIKEDKAKEVPREGENVLITCISMIPHYSRMFVVLEHVMMHVYRPLLDRWFTLELRLPKEEEISSFRGCIGQHLVFGSYRRDLQRDDDLSNYEEIRLYDVAKAKIKHVPDPFESFKSELMHGKSLKGIRRSYIPFSKTLVCIVGNYETTEPFETWPPQLILHYDKNRWKKIGDLPRARQNGYFVWIEHRGEMYILNSRMGENGVWCKISSDGDTFKVTTLAMPPYGVQPDSYGMEVTYSGSVILVGEVYRSYDMMHCYYITNDQWFDITRPQARIRRTMLPIKETERMRKMTGVNMSPDLKGDGTDPTWMWVVQQICPYGAVLKRCVPETVPGVPTPRDDDQRTENCAWTQQCCPSSEKLRKIKATRMSPVALSYFQPAEYKDFTGEDGFSRLRKSGLLNEEEHASVTSSANVFLDFDDDY